MASGFGGFERSRAARGRTSRAPRRCWTIPVCASRGTLLALVVLLASSSAAFALSDDANLPTNGFSEILCGPPIGCASLVVPSAADGFDFEFGARALASAIHLEIETQGSVFLLGPVRATGDIRIHTETLEVSSSISTGDPGEVEVGGGRVPGSGAEISVGDVTIVVGEPPDPIVVAPPSVSVLEGSLVLRTAAATTAEASPSSSPDPLLLWRIEAEGDVFLDLSGVELASLDVFAKRRIRVAEADTNPIPEPTTALLLGLGMTALAHRRTR